MTRTFASIAIATSILAAPSLLQAQVYVGDENLEFTFSGTKMTLANKTPCDVVEVEMQTFPTASTAASRLAGMGSYYYKVPRIERGYQVTVEWSKFTNREGSFLDRSKYSFNRVAIYAYKCPGKKQKRFGEHVGLNF